MGLWLVLALLVAAAAVAVVAMVGLARDHTELQDHNVPYAVAISSAALNAKGIANDERGFLISGDPEFLDEIEQRLLNVRTAFAEASIAAADDEQRRAATAAHEGFERWVFALQQEFKTFQAGDRKAATKASLGPVRTLRKDYEAALVDAQDVATTAIQLTRNSFSSSGWAFVLLGSLLVVLAVGVGTTFWLMHLLSKEEDAEEPLVEAAPVSYLPPREGMLGRRRS
jgi:methyl-accepting chemotaxis protein